MSDFIIINDTNNLEELESNKAEWDAQTHFWKKKSDEKSIEIYGRDNTQRYNELKSNILSRRDDYQIDNIDSSNLLNMHKDVTAIYDTTDSSIFDNWEEKVDKAETTELNTGYKLVYTKFLSKSVKDELELLNDKWHEFLFQPSDNRALANGSAMNIFGVNNDILYYKIKAKLLEDIDSNELKSGEDFVDNINNGKVYRDTLNLNMESYDIIQRFDQASLLESKRDASKTIGEYLKYDKLLDEVSSPLDFSDIVPQFAPLLTTTEAESYGVFSDNNFYHESTNEKNDMFLQLEKGVFPDAYGYSTLIKSLYEKYEKSNFTDNSIAQELLENCWNPDVKPDSRSFHFAREKYIKYVNEKYNSLDIINLSKYDSSESISSMNEETINTEPIFPVFIVCTFTYTDFGKIVRKVTHSTYSHAAMGFEPGLTELYSFNMKTPKKRGGLSFESINGYINDCQDAELFVGCVFLSKPKYLKLRANVDWYIANYDKCNYSIANLFNILINRKTVRRYQKNMVCSQFVDNLFKLVNVDLSGKTSNLTTPNDISTTKNEKVFIIYEGLAKDYDKNRTIRMINSIQKKYARGLMGSRIAESSIDLMKSMEATTLEELDEYSLFYKNMNITPLLEKSIPINFNNDGDLIIDTSSDFENEYQKSHSLLIQYDQLENIEPMKYELSKLWYMNNVIEQKIHKPNCKDKQVLVKLRARILNDFKKYIKVVLQNQKDFNFTEYYNSSNFADNNIKISKTTMNSSLELLKKILKK